MVGAMVNNYLSLSHSYTHTHTICKVFVRFMIFILYKLYRKHSAFYSFKKKTGDM